MDNLNPVRFESNFLGTKESLGKTVVAPLHSKWVDRSSAINQVRNNAVSPNVGCQILVVVIYCL